MSDFRFAVSAWIWHGDPSAENYGFIGKAAEMGYDGVEIPTFDGNIDPSAIRQRISSLDRKMDTIVVGGASPDMDISSGDEKVRERGLQYIMKLVDKAQQLESGLVCGPLYSAVGKALYLTDAEREKTLDRTAKYLRKAADYASGSGIDIALEPLCRYDSYLINTAYEMNRFLDMAGADNALILLDTFHMNIEESSMEGAIMESGKRFRHFQVCENNRGVPGKGQLDWKGIREAVMKSGYRGWISLESFTPYEEVFSSMMRSWRKLASSPDAFASQGLEYLKKIFV